MAQRPKIFLPLCMLIPFNPRATEFGSVTERERERERERENLFAKIIKQEYDNKKYNGRLPEGVSTPSMLATYVNISNNIDNERKTNRTKQSKQKHTNKA